MKLIDLHCDTIWRLLDLDRTGDLMENRCSVSIPDMKKAGTKAQFFACFTYIEDFKERGGYDEAYAHVLEMADYLLGQTEQYEESIGFSRSFEDMERMTAKNRIGAFLAVEEGGVLNGDISRLDELYQAEGKRQSMLVESIHGIRTVKALALEPQLNPQVLCALYAPTSGLTSPYEMAFALADHAAVNGARFFLNEEVEGIARGADGLWHVTTDRGAHTCRIFVNCAGVGSANLHNMMGGQPLRIIDRRGQYILLDRIAKLPFGMTIFQCPTKMGKGVLVSPTVHGNLLLGPTAEDIPDELDTATTADGLALVLEKSRLTWPNVSVRGAITNFSGIRAHEEKDDFIIGAVEGCEGAYEAVGIESPGLSAAPAIGEMLGGMIAREQGLTEKADIEPPCPRKKPFCEMSAQERAQAVAENPLYGNVVCRCEVVTEAEIREAIHRPVGATTIDGVKRRTRAGMGRCQGGFCAPRVAHILAQELGVSMLDITKCGGESRLLTGGIREAMKGETP